MTFTTHNLDLRLRLALLLGLGTGPVCFVNDR